MIAVLLVRISEVLPVSILVSFEILLNVLCLLFIPTHTIGRSEGSHALTGRHKLSQMLTPKISSRGQLSGNTLVIIELSLLG